MSTVLENGGVRICVRPRSYLEKLDYLALFRRFVADLPEDASREERDMNDARFNYVYLTSFTTIEAGGIVKPHRAMSEDEFEAGFMTFAALDEHFIEQTWIQAVKNLSSANGNPALLPQETSTEGEPDPNA